MTVCIVCQVASVSRPGATTCGHVGRAIKQKAQGIAYATANRERLYAQRQLRRQRQRVVKECRCRYCGELIPNLGARRHRVVCHRDDCRMAQHRQHSRTSMRLVRRGPRPEPVAYQEPAAHVDALLQAAKAARKARERVEGRTFTLDPWQQIIGARPQDQDGSECVE